MKSKTEQIELDLSNRIYQLETIQEISLAISSTHDINAIIQTILQSIMGTLGVTRGAVLLYDERSKTLRVQASKGLGGGKLSIDLMKSDETWLAQRTRVISTADRENDRVRKFFDKNTHKIDSLSAMIWSPLAVRNKLLGVISLGEKLGLKEYGIDDYSFITTMSGQAAQALENAKSYQIIEQSRKELDKKLYEQSTLYEVSKSLIGTLDLSVLLNQILLMSIGITGAKTGLIFLFDEGESVLVLKKAKGFDESPEGSVRLSVDAEFRDWILNEKGKPFRLPSKGSSSPIDRFLYQNKEETAKIEPVLFVPMLGKDGLVGLMSLGNKLLAGKYEQDEIDLLGTIANQASLAVENARLYENVIDARDRESRIRNIFQKYVPKDVVDEVLKHKDDSMLVGENKEVTILISDIRGFTSITERLSPEKVVQMLNEYFAEMIDVVVNSGGIIDKFMGDALMAFFGAPMSYGNDAERAVTASIEMIERLNELNIRRRAREEEEIRIGIGLSTGSVVVGNIGSEMKMEYTVIGDDVNLTSRIEKLTKDYPNQILVSRSTYEKVKDCIRAKKLKPVQVRGKSAPVQIYQVEGRR